MARCEDYPCCGHELGCCPDFDPDTGAQLNMKCTCGAVLPIDNPVSICDACLRRMDEADDIFDDYGPDLDDEDEEELD